MTGFTCRELDIFIKFEIHVIETLSRLRQTGARDESGGMLFTNKVDTNHVIVKAASRPTTNDIRTRNGFIHDKKSSQMLISKFYSEGLHYIGDWHSHAQINPIPSTKDFATINSVYQKSTHNLNYFLMLITSNDEDFSKSYLGLTDGKSLFKCEPDL